jgi:phosphatidylglycerophosphate synthase
MANDSAPHESAGRASPRFEFQRSLKARDPSLLVKLLPVERYFTRPLAALIVRLVYRTPVTPNQLTLFSFFLGMAAGAAFFGANPLYFALGGILFQLSSIFDCADGMLARSKGMCTRFGGLLDLVADRFVDFAVLTGVAVGHFTLFKNPRLFHLALVNVGLYFLQVSLYYLMHNYQGSRSSGQAAESRGLTVFILLVLSLLNRLDIFICLVTLETLLNLTGKVLTVARWGKNPDQT